MIMNRDYFNNPIAPDYVLCKANKERIGVLRCTEKTADIKFKDLNEIQFTTYMNIDGEKNPYYDAVDIMKYILLPDIGFFCISDCTTQSEGTEFEYKEITAKSYECLLGQKYLESFVINMGTVSSIDSVQLYNIADKEHSLLHLVLEKCPDWQIGHIDTALISLQRSFEIDRQDVYSFLMNDVSEAFGCVFLFDTLTNTINIYQEENVGEDTNIHVSHNNLLKNTNISCSLDDIKTCLTITGSDDLTIREVNMGFDRIYSFDAFNSTEYMSESLYNAYNAWIKLYNENLDKYNTLLAQYQDYYSQINYLTNIKMPDDAGSTDWTEYGLIPLQGQLASYEQKQAVMMKSGWGNSSNKYYETQYLPVYNEIQNINTQIEEINSELTNLQSEQEVIYNQMSEIMNLVEMENNFTEDELKELSIFIREDELNSDNYVVTDTMTDEERFEMLNEMLAFGQKELQKVSTPQLSFSVNMVNIFAIPEFERLYNKFDVGNYLWVTLRDDYNVKANLLTMHINFYDVTDFSVTFGNIARKAKTRYTTVAEMIKTVNSVATSVSFNSSHWSEAYKNADNITQMLSDGLLSSGNYLSNGDDSELLIDTRGIFVNTTSGDYANKDSIFIGGGRVLFSDDAWKTVAMAVGRADVNGESRFGVFADFCIAAYIAGSTIEGNEIIGGTITGTVFNNGDGTFLVDETGNLTAISATIKGDIQADSGYIGGENGFTITSGKLYSDSKLSFNSINSGVYIGTDGISLGANNPFSVDFNGKLIAKSGTIGGAIIEENSIKASNGKWYINSDGTSSFTTPYIGGVQIGSTFGGITYNNNGTNGNFNYGFNADTSFGLNGGALTNFNELVANKVTAEYIDATVQLTAKYATISSLNATNATVNNLNASVANLNTVVATKADIEDLNATNATVENLKTSSISCNRLTSGTVNGREVDWLQVDFISDLHLEYETKTINGVNVNSITEFWYTPMNLYLMADMGIFEDEF